MSNKTTRFEQRFEGKSNAGLRARIRDAANGAMPACGPVVEQAVLALENTVALTAVGQETLRLVAADYRSVNGEQSTRCSCDACYAGNMQLIVGALAAHRHSLCKAGHHEQCKHDG